MRALHRSKNLAFGKNSHASIPHFLGFVSPTESQACLLGSFLLWCHDSALSFLLPRALLVIKSPDYDTKSFLLRAFSPRLLPSGIWDLSKDGTSLK